MPLIESREAVNLINEALGCLRVSESCSGVDGYGLLANKAQSRAAASAAS